MPSRRKKKVCGGARMSMARTRLSLVWHWAINGCPKSLGNAARDRKSTRLNSSHSQISYAVFCLKKKNNSGSSCDSTSNFSSLHRSHMQQFATSCVDGHVLSVSSADAQALAAIGRDGVDNV